MLSEFRQQLHAAGQNLAGDGMLARLRNSSIALLGAVAAVGLGLTVFIAQLGFPAVFSSPIPGAPTKAGSVHSAIALTHSPGPASSQPSVRVGSATVAPAHSRRTGDSASGAHLGGSHQLAVSPGGQSGPAAAPQSASPVAASEPTVQPIESSSPAASPAPAPVPAQSPPQSSAGGQLKGAADVKTASNAPAVVKATSDGKVAKSKDSPSVKSAKDQGAASPPKPVATSPSQPAKETPVAANPAAAKEAADSGQ